MAVFGAPAVTRDHARNAVKAGHRMVERVKELGKAGTIPPIRIGIGLNSGTVTAGNVGNEFRKFYFLTGKKCDHRGAQSSSRSEFSRWLEIAGAIVWRPDPGMIECPAVSPSSKAQSGAP